MFKYDFLSRAPLVPIPNHNNNGWAQFSLSLSRCRLGPLLLLLSQINKHIWFGGTEEEEGLIDLTEYYNYWANCTHTRHAGLIYLQDTEAHTLDYLAGAGHTAGRIHVGHSQFLAQI